MKRIFKSMTALALCCALVAGCAQETETTTSTTEDTSGEMQTVTLKIAHNMDFVTIPDAVVKAGERLNEKYAAEGKNITVAFETDYQRIDWADYMQNVMFAEMNGEGPDIYSTNGDMHSLVKAGMALDITDLMTDDFVDGAATSATVDGKVYAMAFDLPVRAIYYSKNALATIGWTEEEIDALPANIASGDFTWEQFIALAEEVQDAGACTWGLAHRPGSGSDFNDILKVLGGSYYDEETGKLAINEEGMTRFFQFMYDAANTSKITPPDLNQLGWTTINQMVGNGDVFAYYGPVYSATYVAGAVDMTPEELVENVAFAAYPKSEYTDSAFVTAAPQTMAINANTEYPEICKDLFVELISGDSTDMLAHHANTIFTLSSIKDANAMEEITTNPILKTIGYMEDLAVFNPPLEGISTYSSELHKQIVLLELGQTDAETAYNEFKTQLELNLDADNISFN